MLKNDLKNRNEFEHLEYIFSNKCLTINIEMHIFVFTYKCIIHNS